LKEKNKAEKYKNYLLKPINDSIKQEALKTHNIDIDALQYNYIIYIKPKYKNSLLFEFI